MSFSTTQLVGFGGQRRSSPPSISYIGNSNQTGAAASHTFSAQSIGATGTNRVTIIEINSYMAGGVSLGTVTLDYGSGATTMRQCVVAYGTTTMSAIVALATPTGTTGDLVINWSGGNGQLVTIAVHRAINLSSATEVTTGNDTTPSAGAVSFTLNNNANAIMVATAVSIDGSTWSTWSSGLTEDSDQYIGTALVGASASGFFATANTPYTVSATAGTGTRGVAVAATWNN